MFATRTGSVKAFTSGPIAAKFMPCSYRVITLGLEIAKAGVRDADARPQPAKINWRPGGGYGAVRIVVPAHSFRATRLGGLVRLGGCSSFGRAEPRVLLVSPD
jgi:hypothetical protein